MKLLIKLERTIHRQVKFHFCFEFHLLKDERVNFKHKEGKVTFFEGIVHWTEATTTLLLLMCFNYISSDSASSHLVGFVIITITNDSVAIL